MHQTIVRVNFNKQITGRYFHLAMEAPEIAKEALPGQFVNIRINNNFKPLLRRPFSIHSVDKDNIEILYEAVGEATEMLSQKKPGEYLDIIGPLGRGFEYRLPLVTSHLPVLVAGGMGVAPLLFLAERLIECKTQSAKRKILVLVGAKNKKQILCEKEFRQMGCEVKIATDDGSKGFKGKVTELLKYLLSTIDYRISNIYACGPRPMLKIITQISEEYHISSQISLEEHMACGIGACMGCVVKIQNQKSKIQNESEYKRVCKEGPVFNAGGIIW